MFAYRTPREHPAQKRTQPSTPSLGLRSCKVHLQSANLQALACKFRSVLEDARAVLVRGHKQTAVCRGAGASRMCNAHVEHFVRHSPLHVHMMLHHCLAMSLSVKAACSAALAGAAHQSAVVEGSTTSIAFSSIFSRWCSTPTGQGCCNIHQRLHNQPLLYNQSCPSSLRDRYHGSERRGPCLLNNPRHRSDIAQIFLH